MFKAVSKDSFLRSELYIYNVLFNEIFEHYCHLHVPRLIEEDQEYKVVFNISV